MLHPSLFILVFLALIPGKALASDFSGCKGQSIGKNDGSTVDASTELAAAEKRIQKLCEKEFPPHIKKLQESNTACAQGAAGTNQYVAVNLSRYVQSLDENLRDACKKMQEAFKESAKYCADRKNASQQLEKKVESDLGKASEPTPKGREEMEISQQAAFKKKYEITNKGKLLKDKLARDAARVTVNFYRKLPEFDEKRANYGLGGACVVAYQESDSSMRGRREGTESKDTKDPALDEIVKNLQEKFTALEKDNKNAAACKQLSSKSGALEKISSMKKQNLWPNGKRAARSLKTLAYSDCQMAKQFEADSKLADSSYKRLSGGTGLEGYDENGQLIRGQEQKFRPGEGFKQVSRSTVDKNGITDGTETLTYDSKGKVVVHHG